MRLALIIPFYNEEKNIHKTLLSYKYLISHFKNLDFLLIDNNSKDNSLKVIKSFKVNNPDVNIKIINEKKTGCCFARKRGLDEAFVKSYDLFISTDADTILHDKYKKNLISSLKKFIEGKNDVLYTKNISFGLTAYFDIMCHFPKLYNYKIVSLRIIDNLMSPIFKGAFFAIKRNIYSKVRLFFLSDHSNMKAEDILLSKLCYWCGGNFLEDSSIRIITSPRKIYAHPFEWLNYYNFDPKLNKLSFIKKTEYVKKNISVFSRNIIKRTIERVALYISENLDFVQHAHGNHPRSLEDLNRFCKFFQISNENLPKSTREGESWLHLSDVIEKRIKQEFIQMTNNYANYPRSLN